MKKTFDDFKNRYNEAMSFRFDNYLKTSDFVSSYPSYEQAQKIGIQGNYYINQGNDYKEFRKHFDNEDWMAESFIEAFSKGDFKKCVENWDFK